MIDEAFTKARQRAKDLKRAGYCVHYMVCPDCAADLKVAPGGDGEIVTCANNHQHHYVTHIDETIGEERL